MTVAPTVQELVDYFRGDSEDLIEVHEDADPSWRHGCYMTTVVQRASDNTHWEIVWQRSGDGEYTTYRDDPEALEVGQVEPYQVVTTKYRAI